MPGSPYDPRYLEGIRAFNRRAWFASHEIWERLWREERGPARLFYKGLIQGAVALHHLANGNMPGARRLHGGCRRYLRPYRPQYLGLEIEAFLQQMSNCLEAASGPKGRRPRRSGSRRPYPRIHLVADNPIAGRPDAATAPLRSSPD